MSDLTLTDAERSPFYEHVDPSNSDASADVLIKHVEHILSERTDALRAEVDKRVHLAMTSRDLWKRAYEKAEVERDKWERSAAIWEEEAVSLLADRTSAEAALARCRELADEFEAEFAGWRIDHPMHLRLRRALDGDRAGQEG